MTKTKIIRSVVIGAVVLLIVTIFSISMKQQHAELKETTPEVFQSRISQFVYGGLQLIIGETVAEVTSNLGNPESFKTEKVKNRHNPEQIDEINELFYDGLYIKIYKVTETNKEFITDLSVTNDRYHMKWGLNVGSSNDEVKNILGSPSEEKHNVFIYRTDEAPSHVSFYFRNGTVYRIDWSFYID